MGRSVPTARQILEEFSKDLYRMADIMPEADARILREIIIRGRKHSAEISYAGIDPYIGFLIALIIDLYRDHTEK